MNGRVIGMNGPTPATGLLSDAPLFYAGWAGIAAFGGLVLATNGTESAGFTAVLVGVAGVMCLGYAMTGRRAVAVAGLVLGLLVALVLAVWLVDDVASGQAGRAAGDAVGLLGAGLVVAGAVMTLRSARRA